MSRKDNLARLTKQLHDTSYDSQQALLVDGAELVPPGLVFEHQLELCVNGRSPEAKITSWLQTTASIPNGGWPGLMPRRFIFECIGIVGQIATSDKKVVEAEKKIPSEPTVIQFQFT